MTDTDVLAQRQGAWQGKPIGAYVPCWWCGKWFRRHGLNAQGQPAGEGEELGICPPCHKYDTQPIVALTDWEWRAMPSWKRVRLAYMLDEADALLPRRTPSLRIEASFFTKLRRGRVVRRHGRMRRVPYAWAWARHARRPTPRGSGSSRRYAVAS